MEQRLEDLGTSIDELRTAKLLAVQEEDYDKAAMVQKSLLAASAEYTQLEERLSSFTIEVQVQTFSRAARTLGVSRHYQPSCDGNILNHLHLQRSEGILLFLASLYTPSDMDT